VPFWAVDTATSYFRGVLGEQDGLIHYTNECMSENASFCAIYI